MVMVIAREPAGIALIKVLPAPEPCRSGHLHQEEGMRCARSAVMVDSSASKSRTVS